MRLNLFNMATPGIDPLHRAYERVALEQLTQELCSMDDLVRSCQVKLKRRADPCSALDAYSSSESKHVFNFPAITRPLQRSKHFHHVAQKAYVSEVFNSTGLNSPRHLHFGTSAASKQDYRTCIDLVKHLISCGVPWRLYC